MPQVEALPLDFETFGGNTGLRLQYRSQCPQTTDLDMVLGSSQVWMSPLPQVAVRVTQISTGCTDSAASDTNMAPDLGHLPSL